MAHRSIDIAPTAGVCPTGGTHGFSASKTKPGGECVLLFHLRLIGISEESGVRCAC